MAMRGKICLVIAAMALLSGAQAASASVLFSDSFTNPATDLSPWSGPFAVITTAPGGGNALTFTGTDAGGDITTNANFSSGTGLYTLTFDFLGNCGNASNCRAFVSSPSGAWILSDTPYPGTANFPDSSTWEHVSYTFATSTTTNLDIEDWSGSSHSGPGSFYLKDLVLTDDPNGLLAGTLSVTPTPLPSTWTIMLLGMAGLGLVLYRRQKINGVDAHAAA
jgi:hypothetical protein